MQSENLPLISVCIATYNQARYIRDCVVSVLRQQGDIAMEILVGDDGSSDETGVILQLLQEEHPGQFIVVRREENVGATANYKDLVRRARGDYIAHLDGDDAWLPGKLQAQVEFLKAHSQCVAVYTNALVIDGPRQGVFTNSQPSLFELPYLACKGNFLMHSSMLYRSCEKWRFLALNAPVIDYLIHLTFAEVGSLGFINRNLAIYRRGTETSMVRNSFPQVQELLWGALAHYLPTLEAKEQRAAIAHFLAHARLAEWQGKAPSIAMKILDAAQELGHSRGRLKAMSAADISVVAFHQVVNAACARLIPSYSRILHARV
ncbi:MAG: glycosyltransferase family 2 protein [Ramlibacter sp.]